MPSLPRVTRVVVFVSLCAWLPYGCAEDRPPRLILPGNGLDAGTSGSDGGARTDGNVATDGSASVVLASCEDSNRGKSAQCASVSAREGRDLPNAVQCDVPATEALAAGCIYASGSEDDEVCCPPNVKGHLACLDYSASPDHTQDCADVSAREGRALPKNVKCSVGYQRLDAIYLGCSSVIADSGVGEHFCCPAAVVAAPAQ